MSSFGSVYNRELKEAVKFWDNGHIWFVIPNKIAALKWLLYTEQDYGLFCYYQKLQKKFHQHWWNRIYTRRTLKKDWEISLAHVILKVAARRILTRWS